MPRLGLVLAAGKKDEPTFHVYSYLLKKSMENERCPSGLVAVACGCLMLSRLQPFSFSRPIAPPVRDDVLAWPASGRTMGSQELVVRSDPRVVSTGRSCARRRRAACLRGSLPSITSQGRLEREPGEDLRRTAHAVAPCRRNDRAQSRSIFSPNIRSVSLFFSSVHGGL